MLDSGDSAPASGAPTERDPGGELQLTMEPDRDSPTSADSEATAAAGLPGERTFPVDATLAASDAQKIELVPRREPVDPPWVTDHFQAGRLFGGYSLIRKLASGGMGVVYLARQESLRRSVALKMILAGDHASEEEIRRFRQEAEAAAQLDHSGIVPIFEVGENAGLHYFSMAYVAGGSLADRLKKGPLPSGQAVEIVRQIAEAVAYAHQRGIIHRDLKPANILMDEEGHPKVSDFGLAKQVSGLSQLTMTGQVMGTPSYMAPEQAAGRTGEVGPASDLYSLGALLYCLVTGRPPFQAASPVETLRQVLSQEPVSPRQLNASVSRDLETVCLKCLQKEPNKRYGNAAALAEDLRRIRAGEPILARPVGTAERLWRWCRRNPAIAGLSAAVACTLLAGILISSLFAAQAIQKEAQARRAQALSDRRWYAAEVGLAWQDWEKGGIEAVRRRLDALVPRAGGPDLRGFEWYYLNRLCHLELRTLRGSSGPLRSVAFSPDGRLLASAGGSTDSGRPGTIQLWDSANGQLIRSWEAHGESARVVAFSPDGQRIVSSSGGMRNQPGEVKLWDSDSGAELRRFSGPSAPIHGVAFSRDGRLLAAASGGYDAMGRSLPGEVLVWEVDQGRLVQRLLGHPHSVLAVAFSPDGHRVASSDSSGVVKIWDAASGDEITSPVPIEERDRSTVTSLAFSPDGRLFAAGGLDRTIRFWDASRWDARPAEPQKPLFTLLHPSPVHGLAFSPDGNGLAAAYEDHTVRAWDLRTRTIRLTLRGHVGIVSSVAFSPDGWRLASASHDETIKVWDATRDRRTMPLRDRQAQIREVYALTISRDGRWLASASADRAARIWDLSTGLVVRTLRGHTDSIRELAFSPDGRWLATGGDDHSVIIWDTASGERRRSLTGFPRLVSGVAFSPDGRWLACSTGGWKATGSVQLFNLGRDGEVISLATGGKGDAQPGYIELAFSPNGRRLAAGCDDSTIRVWDLDSRGPARVLPGHSAPVLDVAYSPDGRWLASAAADGAVKLWDAATGATIATLSGHSARVGSIAFDPDGRRLASAGLDLAVRFWDPVTLEQDPRAQEIGSLGVPWAPAGVAFHPDGRRLAIGGSFVSASDLTLDHSLAIWDARGPDPDLDEQDEARSRVAFLFDRSLTAEQVREHLLHDPSLAESARRRALDFVDSYGRARALRQAEDRISRLASQGLFQSEIVERLRTDPDLTAEARSEALELARSPLEHPVSLDLSSQAVGNRPGATTSAYGRALAQAETACRLAPHRSGFQVTRGMALYRLGKYGEALESLSRADPSREPRGEITAASRLALVAMAEYRLGRRDQAAASLRKLREMLRQRPHLVDDQVKSFRNEAEELIEPGAPQPPESTPDRR
jgi:WD40 repeat protein